MARHQQRCRKQVRVADIQLAGCHTAHGLSRGVNPFPVNGVVFQNMVKNCLDPVEIRRDVKFVVGHGTVRELVHLRGQYKTGVLFLPGRVCKAHCAVTLGEGDFRVSTAGSRIVNEQHQRIGFSLLQLRDIQIIPHSVPFVLLKIFHNRLDRAVSAIGGTFVLHRHFHRKPDCRGQIGRTLSLGRRATGTLGRLGRQRNQAGGFQFQNHRIPVHLEGSYSFSFHPDGFRVDFAAELNAGCCDFLTVGEIVRHGRNRKNLSAHQLISFTRQQETKWPSSTSVSS